jgi:TPR repeat protein
MFRFGTSDDRPSRNLDYLLEDDEPKSRRGLFIGFILIALLLAGGLGYLRFRNGTLPNLMGGSASPPKTASADSETASNPPSTSTAAGSEPAIAPTPPTSTPVPPAPDTQQLTQVHPKNPAESIPEPTVAAPATKPAPEPPKPITEAKPEASKPEPPKPAPKPPEDSVALGEKYIYGRGVPQDCSRGLRTVRPAADQGNLKAMITMGALYATGHCIARDLPTAYRFFALALRKDPNNAALKQNIEMIWAQMTQLERQQAIRLTQ